MPYMMIKMWPGRSDEQKQQLADALSDAMVNTLGVGREHITVTIEDVPSTQWQETVVEPFIIPKQAFLFPKKG